MSAPLYTTGGTVQASGGLYIQRAADRELLALCRQGEFAFVLTARQLGKSSLIAHAIEQLRASGGRAAFVDLNAVGTQLTAEQWYLDVLTIIADQTGVQTDPVAWWAAHTHAGVAARFSRFLREVLLAEVPDPVTIFVDEIDTTLGLGFTDDFFAAIRALHNERSQTPALKRLGFVLVGVAQPGDLIKDPERTPFNIGQRVSISDFTQAEAAPLAAGLGLPPADAVRVLARVLHWTGGHPYLTQRVCAALAASPAPRDNAAVDAVVRALFFGEQARLDGNLQFVRDILTRGAPERLRGPLLEIYRRVLRGLPVRDDERDAATAHLRLSGVVRSERGRLQVRNPIYATVFDAAWAKANLPADYWALQTQRVLVGITAVAIAVTLLFGLFLAGSRSREAELKTQRDVAEQQRSTAVAVGVIADQQRAAAVSAQQTAEARRVEAEQVRLQEAQARANVQTLAILVAQSIVNPELGLLLTIAAAEQVTKGRIADESSLIESALHQAIGRSSLRQRVQLFERIEPRYTTIGGWFVRQNGELAVTLGNASELAVVDPLSGQALATLRSVASASSTAVSWSPDLRSAALCQGDQLRVVIVASGVQRWDTATKGCQIVWRPDSQQLAVSSGEATRIYDATSGTVLQTWSFGAHPTMAWSPDGTRLAVAFNNFTVPVFDVRTGSTLTELADHTGLVLGISWNADGTRLLTASADNTARIWDSKTGILLKTLAGHRREVWSAAWSPDQRQIATASNDGTLRTWDAETGQQLVVAGDAVEGVSQTLVAWGTDNQTLLRARDSELTTWDVRGPTEVVTLPDVTKAAWSPDGQILGVVQRDGSVELYDRATWQLSAQLQEPGQAILDLAWNPAGGTLATVGKAGALTTWDAASGARLTRVTDQDVPLTTVLWNPRGTALLTLSANNQLTIWDRPDGHVTARYTAAGSLYALAWSPDGQQIAVAVEQRPVVILNATDGRVLRELPVEASFARDLAWRPDSAELVTIGFSSTAEIWNVRDGIVRRFLVGPSPDVFLDDPGWSADGRILTFGGNDSVVRLVDAASGHVLHELRGHTDTVVKVSFSPDGTQLLTVSADRSVRLWDAASGRLISQLTAQDEVINAAAWNPDGTQIVTTSRDGRARVYLTRFADLLTFAKTRVTRQLTADERQRYGLSAPSATPTP